jgi:hypothetical protein
MSQRGSDFESENEIELQSKKKTMRNSVLGGVKNTG